VHVAPVRPQVENGVADELARAMVRHVTATSRFVDLDAKAVELGRRREDVRTATVTLHPDSDDRRVLEQEEQVGHMARATLLHESSLEVESFRVRDHAESPNLE